MAARRLPLLLLSVRILCAQDVAITNTRIIVGNGTVVPSGTIVVRAGKIVSAGPGAAGIQGLTGYRRQGYERDAGLH